MDRISHVDCIHLKTALLIESSRLVGDDVSRSSKVWVCKRCGQFRVQGWENGTPFEVDFVLVNAEQLEAAGRYIEYLTTTPSA